MGTPRWNGIEAPACERMASKEAPNRKEATFGSAMGGESFHGILGAAGQEAASRAEHRTDDGAITLEEHNEQSSH